MAKMRWTSAFTSLKAGKPTTNVLPLFFFGGGWIKGTPLKSASIVKWAAGNGMVGIAPDYRTENRFDTSPLASVDDGRVAFAWVVEHANELGVDPSGRIISASILVAAQPSQCIKNSWTVMSSLLGEPFR